MAPEDDDQTGLDVHYLRPGSERAQYEIARATRAFQCGRWRYANMFGQRLVGQPSIRAQLAAYREVDSIQA